MRLGGPSAPGDSLALESTSRTSKKLLGRHTNTKRVEEHSLWYCACRAVNRGVPKGFPHHLDPVKETPNVTNCGVNNHPEECLCDVVVTEATPINYGLTDLWHGEMIARMKNLGVPWRAADVAEFGETLLKAHDLWARRRTCGATMEDSVIRESVCDLLRAGGSMVDVSSILGQPFETIIRAMTFQSPAAVWNWDATTWLRAEAIIHDKFADHGCDALKAMLGEDIHFTVVYTLADWYGVKVNENGEKRLNLMKQLLRDGWHHLDVRDIMLSQGYAVNGEQTFHQRKRLVQRGEVSSPTPSRKPIPGNMVVR